MEYKFKFEIPCNGLNHFNDNGHSIRKINKLFL